MKNVLEGYKYFIGWRDECNKSKDECKENFLAWQTWDLLQIVVTGAEALVDGFYCRNPGYFIVLSKVNGNAVESLLSQLKYSVACILIIYQL